MQLKFYYEFCSCCSGTIMLSSIAAVFSVCGISPQRAFLSHKNSTESQQCNHCSSNLPGKEKPHPEGPGAAHGPLRTQSLVFSAGETVVCEDNGKDRDTGGTSICSVSLAWVLAPKRSWNPALQRCHRLASWTRLGSGFCGSWLARAWDTLKYTHQ